MHRIFNWGICLTEAVLVPRPLLKGFCECFAAEGILRVFCENRGDSGHLEELMNKEGLERAR